MSLAAVLDVTPLEAARALWAVRTVWANTYLPRPASSGVYGTSLEAVADVLVRNGHGVEMWSGDGRLLADPSIYAEALAVQVQERVGEVRRRPARRPGRDREGGGPDGTPAEPGGEPPVPELEGPTLADWLERRPGGGWWLVSLVEPGGLDSHMVATYGPRILVAEEEQLEKFGAWTVFRAYRVFI